MIFLNRFLFMALMVLGGTVWCQNLDNHPGRVYNDDEVWAWQLNHMPLLNLTMLLLKDCHIKLRMADQIQEQYKYSIAYELGLLAAGIMEKFKHMLKVYRQFSDLTTFQQRKYDLDKMLEAYHFMQSDYHELRMEKDMYFGILEKHQKANLKDPRSQQLLQLQQQYGLDPSALEQAKKHGLLGPNVGPKKRRSMNTIKDDLKNLTVNVTIKDLINDVTAKLKKLKGVRTRKNKGWKKEFDVKDEEYKKKLRYIKWAESWRGFNPKTEGVYIPEDIANIGLTNTSDFLAKELIGLF